MRPSVIIGGVVAFFVAGIILVSCGAPSSGGSTENNGRSFDQQTITVDGHTCVVVHNGTGIAVSCNWAATP